MFFPGWGQMDIRQPSRPKLSHQCQDDCAPYCFALPSEDDDTIALHEKTPCIDPVNAREQTYKE